MNKVRNFRRAIFILVVFLLLAGLHLIIYAQNIGLNYQLTDLKVKYGELLSRNRQLRSQVARGENLGLVEQAAKSKLGMAYPEAVIYIVGSREVAPKPSLPPGSTAATAGDRGNRSAAAPR